MRPCLPVLQASGRPQITGNVVQAKKQMRRMTVIPEEHGTCWRFVFKCEGTVRRFSPGVGEFHPPFDPEGWRSRVNDNRWLPVAKAKARAQLWVNSSDVGPGESQRVL